MGTYHIYNSSAVSKEYLAHHGVKGMKWGVRRYQKKDGSLTPAGQKRYADDLSEKRAAYKDAKKAYDKSFNKAYNKAAAAYSPIKKHRQANDERWNDAAHKAEVANKARAEYKKAKKEFKQDVKSVRKAASNRYTNVVDSDTGMYIGVRDNLITVTNSIKTKKGQEYAERVVKKANSQLRAQAVTAIATSALVVAGAGWLSSQSY